MTPAGGEGGPGERAEDPERPAPEAVPDCGGRLLDEGPAEVIAIDGPAGSGKSTTALGVARALGFRYVDSGALYRAATLIALRRGLVDGERVEGPAVARAFAATRVEQRSRDEENEVLLDGEPVGEALRSPEIARLVSRVAAEPEVRRVVTERLRAIAREGPLVMDGRDIGTVVFPRARLKVFLDASVEERARRRSAADRRPVAPDALAHRDLLDATRATAPLAPAADAVRILSDELTLAEQVESIVRLYRSRVAVCP